MTKLWFWGSGVLVAILILSVALFWRSEASVEVAAPAPITQGAAKTRAATDTPQRTGEVPGEATPHSRATLALHSARAHHEQAAAALADAEHELADVELEVTSIERFIEDLELRGEDPARHAEEGMRRLDPVLERFEERLAAVDEAEANEATTRAQLEAAQATLDATAPSP